MAYLELCVTLAYLEPCHIQNPGIFRNQDIFRSLSRHILAYSECCVMFTYWWPCHIQYFVICRSLGYLGHEICSESCSFRHIQTYPIMIAIITSFFFLFLFNLPYFSMKFKKTCFWTTVTSVSMLDWVYSNNMWSLKNSVRTESIKLVFSSENKLFDGKESSLPKYYCVRTKLNFSKISYILL